MDPLTAFGLAANVLAFVDFATKVISSAHDLYVSGTTAENAELEIIIAHVRKLASNATSQDSITKHGKDSALVNLSNQCHEISNELLALLQSFKVSGSHKMWKSVYQALRSSKYAGQVTSLQQRLDRIAALITDQLLLTGQNELISDSKKAKLEIMARLDKIQAENTKFGVARAAEVQYLHDELEKMFSSLENRTESRIQLISSFTKHVETIERIFSEQTVLNALHFNGMGDRYASIKPAHKDTFTWAFNTGIIQQSEQSPAVPRTLGQWLRSDESLFWISGKPGSGKSTFMKHITDNTLQEDYLKLWADSDSLLTASFFFWDLGKEVLQKSQEGLIRSILYQILAQKPDLIAHTFPSAAHISDSARAVILQRHVRSLDNLLSSISNVSAALSKFNTKCALFIDGLDEYDGRSADVIKLVEALKSSPNMKICVSSRPWNEFERAFGGCLMKLYIQDLTKRDIEKYVRDNFENDASFQEAKGTEDDCTDLINDICKNANGVFLWVKLVVQSLLDGLTNGDRMIDLKQRFNTLPSDLNQFFERIIGQVEALYHSKMAQFFLLTLKAHALLPLLAYWYIDQEDCPEKLYDAAITMIIQPVSWKKTSMRLQKMRKRLNACCKGLLEVDFARAGEFRSSSVSTESFQWRANFIHRTAKDFLGTARMRKMLEDLATPKFEADIVICVAILSQIKASPQEKELFFEGGAIYKLVKIFNAHKKQSNPATLKLEDDFKATITKQLAGCNINEKDLPNDYFTSSQV